MDVNAITQGANSTQRVKWEDTEFLREALYYSRIDHDGKFPPHTGAMERIEKAEAELQRLLGYDGPFSYLGSPADQRAWEQRMASRATDDPDAAQPPTGQKESGSMEKQFDFRKTLAVLRQFDFGEALEALRAGKRVQRAGWNGKGMWLALQPGYPEGVPANATSAKALHVAEGEMVRILPYIAMKTVDGGFVPWLASQTDVLAQDWSAVE
jgi:hypothetical protein